MDREAIEKLAIDMEKKRVAWEALSRVNTFGKTPEERVALDVNYAAAYTAFLYANKKYLDAIT